VILLAKQFNITLSFGNCLEDDVPAADQATRTNVAGLASLSGGGGLIQTTSG